MLVGRDGELERLGAALDDVGLVALRGPFGIGKTAVVGAFARQHQPTLVGQALHALAARPYQPFLHALDRPPHSAEPAAMARLLTPVLERCELLVLEDLQWADPGTLEVLVGVRSTCRIVVTVQDGVDGSQRVLRLVSSLGGSEVHLDPLGPDALDAWVQHVRPDLLRGERARIVEASGGNPLIASVLARCEGGDDTPRGDGRAIVSAFVAQQPPDARYSLALLSQSEAPMPPQDLGGIAALEEAGLVEQDAEGRVGLRHAMFGRAAYEGLTGPDRARLFQDLVTRGVGDAPARAEFLLRAGAAVPALQLASQAAAGPLPRSEQARAWRVAVQASRTLRLEGDPDALDDESHLQLVVEAARSLNDRLEHEHAAEVLDELGSTAPGLRGEAVVEVLRAALGRGDRRYAAHVLESTDTLVDALDEPVRRTARTLHSLLSSWTGDVELSDIARGQWELARTRTERSHAALLVGLASYRDDVGRIDEWFELARSEAAQAGACCSELEAARNLVMVQLGMGRKDEARTLTRQCIAKAEAAGEVGWAAEFRCLELLGSTYEGVDHDRLLSELSLARSAPVRLETRAFVTSGLAALLADRGAARRSAEVLEAWTAPDALAGFDPMVQAVISWGAAQRAWIIGDLAETIRTARWATERLPHGFPAIAGAQTIWRWAEYESGVTITAPTPAGGFLGCARLEAEAIDLLVVGDHEQAAEQFALAEESWRPVLWRAALRCRWGAGHAWALAGAAERAVALLQPLDDDLERFGSPALRPRVHASLRIARARPAAVGRPGAVGRDVLSRRERDVLDLVADGLTSSQVARRLGLSVATVNTHVASATRKLGVHTRAAAVAQLRALS